MTEAERAAFRRELLDGLKPQPIFRIDMVREGWATAEVVEHVGVRYGPVP